MTVTDAKAGYKDRSAAIAASDLDKADPRGTIFNHTIVANGKVIGIWKRTIRKATVDVELIPFAPLSKVNQTAIVTAAKRYARYPGVKAFYHQYLKSKNLVLYGIKHQARS